MPRNGSVSRPEVDIPAVDPTISASLALFRAALLNFEEVFTDNLCKFACDRLIPFHVSHAPPARLLRHDGKIPYTSSLEFTTVLEDVIR